MKGAVQREQQMSRHWPLWWQRLGLELKGIPPPARQSSSPTHTHTHCYLSCSTDGEVDDRDDTSYLICTPPQYPAASKASLYPPRAAKIFKVCGVCLWGGGTSQGELYKSRRQSTKANALPSDIFRGIYSHAYSSPLFSTFMHIHYFTWLKYPPRPVISLRVQIQLVWWSDDEPFKTPHALADSLSLFSCFPIQPVCICLFLGSNHRRHPREKKCSFWFNLASSHLGTPIS